MITKIEDLPYLTRIHAVDKGPGPGRAYCGPSAISALTGVCARGEIRATVNRCRGRKPTQAVIGMHNHEMHAVLRHFGLKLVPIYAAPFGNLCNFVTRPERVEKVYLVEVTNHYVVTKGRFVIDNHEPDGADVDDHPSARKKVHKAWVVKCL